MLFRSKVNPLKAQAFAAWQQQQSAQDPRFLNKAFAMAQFQQKQMEAAQNQPQRTPVMLPSLDSQGNPTQKPFGLIQPPGAPVGAAAALGGAAPVSIPGAAVALGGGNAPPPGLAGANNAIAGVAMGAPPAAMAAAPPAPIASASPPSKIPGVSRAANGAYLPSTAADYAKLPPGSAYIKPGESVVRTKKGA